MATGIVNSSPDILNSWKEIACYLNRGVRTVQRWEAELSLPVRRPGGKGRSAVIAMRSEIDVWLRSCPLETREEHAVPEFSAPAPCATWTSNHELLSASRRLRDNVERSRLQVTDALAELVANLGRMLDLSRPEATSAILPAYNSAREKSTAA